MFTSICFVSLILVIVISANTFSPGSKSFSFISKNISNKGSEETTSRTKGISSVFPK